MAEGGRHSDARRARRQHRKRVARIVYQQWLHFASQALTAVRHRRRCQKLQGLLAFQLARQRSRRNQRLLKQVRIQKCWQVLLSSMACALSFLLRSSPSDGGPDLAFRCYACHCFIVAADCVWCCRMQEWWKKAAQYARILRHIHDAAAHSRSTRQRRDVWDVWVAKCRARRRLHHLHTKALLLHEGINLSKGMCAFKRCLEHRRLQALQHGRAVLYNMQKCCSSILISWKAYACDKRSRRLQLAAARSRTTFRRQTVCLMAFIQHVHEQRGARRLFVNVFKNLRVQLESSVLSKAFQLWREMRCFRCTLRLIEAKARAQSSSTLGQIMTRKWQASVAIVIRNQIIQDHAPQLARCILLRHSLLQWRRNMRARQVAREHKANQIRILGAVWTIWKRYCAHKRHRAHVLHAAHTHWASRCLCKAWDGLRIAQAHLRRTTQQATELQRLQASRKARHSLQWWLLYTLQQARQRRLLMSLTCTQQRYTVTTTLQVWVTAGQHEQAAGMADLLRRTLLWTRAWRVWSQYSASRAQHAEMRQCASRHSTWRMKRAAFRAWLLHHAAQAQHSLALFTAEAHDQRRCTARLFEAWKMMRLQGHQEGDLQKHKTAQMLVARCHWQGALTCKVFLRWQLLQQACAPRRAAVEAQIEAAHARRRLVLISSCWNAWEERYRQQQVQQQQLKVGDRHHCRHLLGHGLLAWRIWLAEQREKQRSVWAALQQWREWRLSRCLQCWATWAERAVQARRAETVALQHRRAQVAAGVMRRLHSHAKQMKWQRAQLQRANAMHDRFLLEQCTHHLMQLGQARLCKHISSEVGRQTAAFAQDLMTVAPFAMRWLLVTRRSKAIRKHAAFRESPMTVGKWRGQENTNNENRSMGAGYRLPVPAAPREARHVAGTGVQHGTLLSRDSCQRRQARRPTFL